MEEDSPPRQITKKISYPSCREFTEKTRLLLKQEQKYEVELFDEMTKNKTIAEIETQGYGLAAMTVVASKRGYYGKTILTLFKTYHSDKNPQLIPQHCKIQVGDDVALFKNNTMIVDGVVSKKIGAKLQVSIRKDLDEENDYENLNCNVVLKWNEVTFRRYFKILDELQKSQSPLLRIFFQENPTPSLKPKKEIQYRNQKLNEQQTEAVRYCISQPAHLLHGPPGTGKTTTVCELIVQAVQRKQKVLACGPSNISVDNIVEGLSGRVNCIRIGNPARIIQNVIERCLDFQIAKQSNSWKSDVKKLQSVRKRLTKSQSRQQRKAAYAQIKQLRDQIYRQQEQVIQQILDDTDVICCTNVGAADRVFRKYLPKRIFDLVVIDQCGQSLEVACWVPMLKGRRVVLAGDHKQLPPTIQGNDNSLLSYTLFSRSMEELSNISSTMLKLQYRMNCSIMGWSNQQFYDNKLKAHSSVEMHTLRQLYSTVSEEQQTLMIVDTSGCGMGQEGGENESKMNVGQADIVIAIYRKLMSYQVQSKHIAILTPYSKQVSYIKSQLTATGLPLPDVSTVDGIQGRQKQCIIISLVRCNPKQQIGFLKDWRRMNVAVTRARRMLVLVGNVQCVSADMHMASLIKWIEENGHICSAQEFRGDQNIRFGQGASDKIVKFEKQNKQSKQKKTQPKKKKIKTKQEKPKQQKEQQHTQQEQQALKSHYRKVFQQILRELTINNASAFERKMIHEVAEQMGMCHQTSNDKKYIKVWKKLTNDEVTQKYAELERLKMEEDIAEANKKKKKKLKQENREAKHINKPQNGPHKFSEGIKDLIGQQSSEDQIEKKEDTVQQIQQNQQDREKEPKKKKKKNKQKNQLKQQQKKEQEDNIQEIMKEFTAERPKVDECYKCKKKITSVTAAECKYCNTNFCRYHLLAEQHGCDVAAREEARRIKPVDKHLEQAAQRLKQKIKQQEQARKRKGKQGKK